jgi:hypothetical protein
LNKHGRDDFGITSGVQELIQEGNQRDGCCTEKSHGITRSLFKKDLRPNRRSTIGVT